MLHVTTFFLLAGSSSAEVPVEIEEVAQLATLVDGFGSLGFGQVLSAGSVDIQCWRMFS